MPQFGNPCEFFGDFIAQPFFWIEKQSQNRPTKRPKTQNKSIQSWLGWVPIADRHTQLCPNSSRFFTRFLCFLKNIFFIKDYETLSQSTANSLNLFKPGQGLGEPILELNLQTNLCIKAYQEIATTYKNYSWPAIKIFFFQSYMISTDGFVALILSPRLISQPISQRGSGL